MALYRFDRFLFDGATGDLQNAGRRVRLRPQPARVLEHLLRCPGELVSRLELQRAVWPEGTFVHFDDGLDSCIKQIRAALGGHGAPRAYIETLVRRGFRFTAPVTRVSAQEPDGLQSEARRVLPVRSAGQRGTAAHRVARLVEEILVHLTGASPAGAPTVDHDPAGASAGSDPETSIHFLLGVTVETGTERLVVRSTLIDSHEDGLDQGLLLRSQSFTHRQPTESRRRRPFEEVQHDGLDQTRDHHIRSS